MDYNEIKLILDERVNDMRKDLEDNIKNYIKQYGEECKLASANGFLEQRLINEMEKLIKNEKLIEEYSKEIQSLQLEINCLKQYMM